MDNDEIISSNHFSSIEDVNTLKLDMDSLIIPSSPNYSKRDGNTELNIDVLQTEDELTKCYVLGYN